MTTYNYDAVQGLELTDWYKIDQHGDAVIDVYLTLDADGNFGLRESGDGTPADIFDGKVQAFDLPKNYDVRDAAETALRVAAMLEFGESCIDHELEDEPTVWLATSRDMVDSICSETTKTQEDEIIALKPEEIENFARESVREWENATSGIYVGNIEGLVEKLTAWIEAEKADR